MKYVPEPGCSVVYHLERRGAHPRRAADWQKLATFNLISSFMFSP
jgi:hypothetical protein